MHTHLTPIVLLTSLGLLSTSSSQASDLFELGAGRSAQTHAQSSPLASVRFGSIDGTQSRTPLYADYEQNFSSTKAGRTYKGLFLWDARTGRDQMTAEGDVNSRGSYWGYSTIQTRQSRRSSLIVGMDLYTQRNSALTWAFELGSYVNRLTPEGVDHRAGAFVGPRLLMSERINRNLALNGDLSVHWIGSAFEGVGTYLEAGPTVRRKLLGQKDLTLHGRAIYDGRFGHYYSEQPLVGAHPNQHTLGLKLGAGVAF